MFKFVVTRYASIATMAGLLVPVSALAGEAWSHVGVDQWQSAHSGIAELEQTATTHASVNLPGQARAQSDSTGAQRETFVGRGSQEQEVHSTAGIEWEDWSWPSAAAAYTSGKVAQGQSASSILPIDQQQSGSTVQKSQVGDTVSRSEVSGSQSLVILDPVAGQEQRMSGSTGATGFIDPPVPPCGYCGSFASLFGGRLEQTVRVFVRNVLTF